MFQPSTYVCRQGGRAQRLLLLFTLLPVVLALNSCGGGSSATAVPSITVSGLSGTVIVNGTVQFTASILNLSSTLVNYSVSGTGTGPFGTIDANGLYTAPAAVPVNNVVTITATAQAQSTLTATTTVTILAATVINSVVCSTPGGQTIYTVASSLSLQCDALDPQNNQVLAVNWLVNNQPGGNTTIGTITAQGNYKAPLIPPLGGSVTITAVSQSVSTETQMVTVTPTYGNAILQGNYAFSTSGKQTANSASFARAGSFVADGNGNLTGGLEDVDPAPTGYTTKPIPFTGLYTVGPDGRGTIQLCENTTKACKAPGTSTLQFVVRSQQEIRLMDFQFGSTAIGEIVQQPDVSVFNNAGLSGAYSFGFAGPSLASTEESAVGEFVADGDPGSTGTGHITSGEVDLNTGGVSAAPAPITGGTYQVSANGRGTATLITAGQTYTLAFYLVSSSRAKFIETDALPILSGDAFKQQSSALWPTSSLNGSVVFQTRGFASGTAVADLVSFMADGNGNVVAGSGTLDQNSGGTATSVASLGGGTYTFDPSGNGRVTLTIPGHSYVLYMIAPWSAQGSAEIQETTSGVVALGPVTQPQGGPFTSASLTGSYALSLAGQNATPRPEDFVGQLTSDGVSKVLSGTLDINNFGATQTVTPNIGTFMPVTANGHTTMLLNPTRNLVLYFVSPTQAYALDTDSATVAVGSIYHQF